MFGSRHVPEGGESVEFTDQLVVGSKTKARF